ncbi:sugar phosphate isomerase/epimerase family protein [Aquamicrobium defluvii]|uniref:Sugar phosphate isomerase/epimerase n=1 Tax=Aquamicrobium defluvii TaxID=69279 RepID=A0A011SS71_9HYPH|nr:sugar phosphate isomerase/epimerase family protein [Aquamicrobium defluvii]EXL01994.1 xylose isomerase [Aquamicrobium defluvii]EZQ13550.1 xylose isomerase [Halopseudomonas bauzanensis]TDR35315.1 sugar phosphate isomerase/epimerase [Aquamicrobium defluvii]
MATNASPFARWGFLAALDYEVWPAEKVADTLAAQGYGAVEWTLAHFDPRRMSAGELDSVISMSRTRGLEVSEIAVQQDLVCADPDELTARVDLTVATARAASASGVDLVNVLTGPNRWEDSHVDVGAGMAEGRAWSLMLDAYERMLDGLAQVGAKAALEPCWGGLAHDFHSTGVMLRRFGKHPAFAINFDPSHFALARDDLAFVIAELAPYIRHVHIKDVAGRPGLEGRDFIFPLIGEGLVAWDEVFQALDAAGFRGFMSVEFESYRYYRNILKSDPAKASELSMEQLRALEDLLPEGLK